VKVVIEPPPASHPYGDMPGPNRQCPRTSFASAGSLGQEGKRLRIQVGIKSLKIHRTLQQNRIGGQINRVSDVAWFVVFSARFKTGYSGLNG
jgi:hypothetical protein